MFTRGRSSRSRFPGRFWPLIATSPLPLSAPAAIASLPAARGAASQPDREGLGGTADDKARAEEAAGSQRAPPGSSCPLGRPGHHADAEPRIPSRVRERVWLLLPPPPAALQRIRAAGRGIRALLVQLSRAVVGWERRGHGVTCGGAAAAELRLGAGCLQTQPTAPVLLAGGKGTEPGVVPRNVAFRKPLRVCRRRTGCDTSSVLGSRGFGSFAAPSPPPDSRI